MEGYSNNDTNYETIFVADDTGKVIATGFDYDGDCYFVPNKRTVAEVHATSNKAELENKEYFNEVIDIATNDRYIRLIDKDGVDLRDTFGDSLFDLWKTRFMGYSSQLIDEARQKTSHQFIESITPQRIMEDIAWQWASQSYAYCVGLILGTVFGPSGFGTLASYLGYFATYAILNIIHSIEQAKQADAYLASQSHDVDIVHLNSKWSMDDVFGGWITDVLLGSTTGIYTEVKHEGEDTQYTGQMVLAQGALSKAQWLILDVLYLDIDMDYMLQTRNYVGFSDGGELLNAFLKESGYLSAHQAELNHGQNSLLYLEEQVKQVAAGRGEDLDKVYPYMFYGQPLMLFGEEENGIAYPEFSEHRPIYVSEEKYAQVQDQVNHIFKVDDLSTMGYDHRAYKIDGIYLPTLDLQLFPEDSANTHDFEVREVAAYVVSEWFLTCQYKYMGAIPAEELEFDPATGILTITSFTLKTIQDYYWKRSQEVSSEVKVIFQVSFEKYRPIDEESEQDKTIALMQATQAATLRYYYQYELAVDSQQKLDEIAYTAFITSISVILTTFTTLGINAMVGPSILRAATSTKSAGLAKLASRVTSSEGATIMNLFTSVVSEIGEEIFVDPLVEAITTAIVRNVFHGDQHAEIIWSTLAESGRETLTGGITSLFNLRQAQGHNQMVMEYLEMKASDTSATELTSRQQFNEFKSFLAQNGESAQRALQERVMSGAMITLSLLKVFTFAIGAGSIASLIALSGATLGLKGLDKTWTYAAKKLQTRSHSEASQLSPNWQKVVDYLKENKKMVVTSIILAALSLTITPLLATINPILAAGVQLGFGTIGMVDTKGLYRNTYVFRWYEAGNYKIRRNAIVELKATALYYLENQELFSSDRMFTRISIEAAKQIENLINIKQLPRFKVGQRLLPGVKPFITQNDNDFKKYASGQLKYGAAIYSIKALFGNRAGESYIGESVNTERRWLGHIYYAINPHERNYDLSNYICLALEDLGYDVSTLWDVIKDLGNFGEVSKLLEKLSSELDPYFKREVLEYHLQETTVFAREKYYIRKYNSYRNGFNMNKGGGGGKALRLPAYDIAYLISLGVSQNQIVKLLNQAYQELDVSLTTLRRRIEDLWGDLYRATEELFRPIMSRVIFFKNRATDLYNAFSETLTRNTFFSAWALGDVPLKIPQDMYLKLKDSGRIDYIKSFDEIAVYGVPISQWEEWAIKGLTAKEINEQGLTDSQIRAGKLLVSNGNYKDWVIKLRKERTFELIQSGENDFGRIYEYFGNKYPDNPGNLYVMKNFFKDLFPGLNFDEIKFLALFEKSHKLK